MMDTSNRKEYAEKRRLSSKRRRLDEQYKLGIMVEIFGLGTGKWKLDKSTTVLLTKCFIKLKRVLRNKPQLYPQRDLTGYCICVLPEDHEECVSKALGGFIAVLAADLTVLFVTNNVLIYTGFSQVEMMGKQILEYIYKEDHASILSALDQCCSDHGNQTSRKMITVRMMNKFSRRKSKCIAVEKMPLQIVVSFGKDGEEMDTGAMCVYIYAIPYTNFPSQRMRLSRDEFVMHLNLQLTIVYCEPYSDSLANFNSADMTGKSLYQCCHPADLSSLSEAHFEVLRTEHMQITYRILDDKGSFVWIHTVAQECISSEDLIITVNEVLWFG